MAQKVPIHSINCQLFNMGTGIGECRINYTRILHGDLNVAIQERAVYVLPPSAV